MALISAKADPNLADPDGETPLMLAAEFDDSDIVGRLIEAGADPNAADKDSRTALIRAASWSCGGKTKVKRILLRGGANPRLVDNDGKTAEDIAARETAEAEAATRAARLTGSGAPSIWPGAQPVSARAITFPRSPYGSLTVASIRPLYCQGEN